MRLTTSEIAKIVGGTIYGDENATISRAAPVLQADEETLTFAANDVNLARLPGCKAPIAIVAESDVSSLDRSCVPTLISVASNVEETFLRVAQSLHPRRKPRQVGISPAADVAASAVIGGGTQIHPNATISEDVEIGTGCTIFPGVFLGCGVKVGNNVVLHPNVVIYEDVTIGNNCTVHANATIGADGFGYRPIDGRHVRIPHVGVVEIQDDVDVGAGTTIDRAKVGATVIGRGTKIDNQVMVAHNCELGEHNLLASQAGLAGSVTTGSYVVFAGQVGVADHVDVGEGAIFGAKCGVHRSMPGGETYLGAPAAPISETRKQLMALRKLPDMRKTVREMEKELSQLKQQIGSIRDADDLPAKAA